MGLIALISLHPLLDVGCSKLHLLAYYRLNPLTMGRKNEVRKEDTLQVR